MAGPPLLWCDIYLVEFDSLELAEEGEICLGGAVSAGYLKRPQETSTKFLPNPFGKGMLYRTGDNAFAEHADV